MFNKDFYPTPAEVIMQMVDGINLQGKIILEPSAGKGDIVDYCIGAGAEVFACKTNQDLKKILSSKCKVIADDFLTVESHHISHIHCIIMNPPFSADEKHILHAYNIAPPGFSEYLNHLDTSYSCAKFENDELTFKLKTSEVGKEKAQHLAEGTFNMVTHLSDVLGPIALNFMNAQEMLKEKWGGEEFGGNLTSHNQQNN